MNQKDEILRSLATMKDMLVARGYKENVLDASFATLGDEEITQILYSKTPIFHIDVADRQKLMIVYDVGAKAKSTEMKKFITGEHDLYIFVFKEKLNTNEQKKFCEFECDYQVFDVKELQFNISKHIMVPKHELITDNVVIDELVQQYMLKSKTHFPIILKSDPMAKFLHAKPGNIVKVTRHSPTSAENIVYRCCM